MPFRPFVKQISQTIPHPAMAKPFGLLEKKSSSLVPRERIFFPQALP